MNNSKYVINGKTFEYTDLMESFDCVWRQLRSASERSAKDKARAADFCLKCADAGICSPRTAASVRRVCTGILKLAAKG